MYYGGRWHLVLTAAVLTFSIAPPINATTVPNKREVVLVLDVDNTLYSEEDLHNSHSAALGMEEQIVRNIHAYCEKHVKIDKGEADQLHLQYGSTIEGLRHTIWNQLGNRKVEENMKHCYETIFNGSMDYSALLELHQSSSSTSLTTGYSHQASQMAQLRDLLEQLDCPLYLASNSPSWHVRKVLQALGLLNVPWRGAATPDAPRGSITGVKASSSNNNKYHLYPTKTSPSIFYQDILHRNDNAKAAQSQVILIDDSQTNINILPPQLLNGIRVRKENPLPTALLQALGVITDPTTKAAEDDDESASSSSSSYVFSQVKYLQTKNVVDATAMHRPTWHKLAKELRSLLRSNPEKEFQIVDVGAGLLSMLKVILEGNHESLTPSLVSLVLQDSVDEKVLFKRIRYFAYEPNRELQAQCIQILQDMGFSREVGVDENDNEYIFVSHDRDHKVFVHLRLFDYNEDVELPIKANPHLLVGCCFADLMDPYQLVPSLIHRFLSRPLPSAKGVLREDCLCYFPITFQGVTQLVPPQPFEIQEKGSIPSDTVAFALYSKALEDAHGHNLDPRLLIKAMKAYGATELASGPADWDIDPKRHPYLWQTMLYFFERVAGPELLKNGWDAAGWLNRARRRGKSEKETKRIDQRPRILVSNLDLLFRIPRLGCAKIVSAENASEGHEEFLEEQQIGIEEIQFTAPYKVSSSRKLGVDLGPHQVQIKSEYSLISSGTELKVFKGLFDDAALDVNIKGMSEERMSYPLAYGYSLVGRVVQCGSDVEDADDLLGRLVFTFSAHASHVITDRAAVQLVPDGIEAKDAIFMPSVETACSIIHDAHVRLGEKVAVFGQGLIGLLVTSILCSSLQQTMDLKAPCCGNLEQKLGTITTFDALPARLSASAAMGASQALLPSEVQASGPFDVAIEVSGNARALQAAIDNTRNHGRLIVGSWYGNADVALKLGIDFHRSHKTIITSQVSEIRPELSGLWSKERRFSLTWELVRQIKPSRLITMMTTLRNAQIAYDALDKGSEIAVAFHYSDR